MERGNSGARPRMSLDDRAKIFSPFDPLQGFREALREKEREVEREAQAGDPASLSDKRRNGTTFQKGATPSA